MSARRRVGLGIVTGLVLLGVLVSLVPVGPAVGTVLFVVVLGLVAVLFVRFNPAGDMWEDAGRLGVDPWWYVLLVVGLGVAFAVLRFGLLDAV